MKKGLISVVIPTFNSQKYIEDCLSSLKEQSYKKIEIIIVDSGSTDQTISIARGYTNKIFRHKPKIVKGISDAPHKRNYGAKKASGEYIYYLDADMVLTNNIIRRCVEKTNREYDAVIIHEDSFGKGVWANAKNLERKCYWGDDYIEAPRFISKEVWDKLGGLDLEIGGGGDDWDFYQKLLENSYKVGRIKDIVKHNEGDLTLVDLMKKRFRYGRQTLLYIKKRPIKGTTSYFPVRWAYIKNWKLFISRPKDSFFFIIMRTCEYSAGLLGIIVSLIKHE